eukprot:1044575-Pyramimonas_sp.AAC.1
MKLAVNSAQPDLLGERVNLEKDRGDPPLTGPALPLRRRRTRDAAQAYEGNRLWGPTHWVCRENLAYPFLL